MLEVALRHRFGRDGFAIEAAFTAPAVGVTALFGPSGCGKSTILAAVAGLVRPREGRVALDGAVVLDTAGGVFVAPERRRFAVVFQEARLFPHLSVETNLRYGLRRAPRDATGPGLDEVVDRSAGHRAPAGAPPRPALGGRAAARGARARPAGPAAPAADG